MPLVAGDGCDYLINLLTVIDDDEGGGDRATAIGEDDSECTGAIGVLVVASVGGSVGEVGDHDSVDDDGCPPG